MYAIIPQQIPQGMRAEVNEKILFAIDSGKNLIPAESIYNCYTGIGGLHNLKQSDFASYHEYAEAKKEFEMGQFFTPHEICRDMVDMLCPVSSEMVLDMCCGMGNFFNHLPNPHNAYGFDIDGKAVSVARYLYPEAHIEKCDIRQYYPEQRFDVIIGNPPFNLKFDYKLSQEYYMDKAYDVLNPAGILMVIVPCSFMQSGFWEKTRIAGINGRFSFVGQTKLGPSAFAAVGVHDFNTKIMVFLRKSGHIKMQAYNAEEFITADELKKRIGEARAMKHRLRFDLMRETNRIDKEELEDECGEMDADELMMTALDAGAEDFSEEEDSFEIITAPDDFSAVREALEKAGIPLVEAQIAMIPQTYVELTDDQAIKDLHRTLDLLDDDDDVTDVWTNWDE